MQPTGRSVNDLMPGVIRKVQRAAYIKPDAIIEAWPEIIGPKCAPMTKAVSFNEGLLYVKVNNSTLLSLLIQHERVRLVKQLRQAFPSAEIRNIVFRMG